MPRTRGISEEVEQKMGQAFFEVLAEGVLSYQDPMIGPLVNRERQLAVVVNEEKSRLELRVRDLVEQVFAFSDGIAEACREAFHAYFATFQSLCVESAQAVRAA